MLIVYLLSVNKAFSWTLWLALGMLIEDRKIETRYKWVLEIEFSNSKLDIAFVFLRKPLHKQLETGHLVSAQMARCGVTAQRALSTVTPLQRRMVSLPYATSAGGALFTKGRKWWSAIHGDPCQEPEHGRTDGRATYIRGRRRSLIAGRWTAHEDDAAAQLFATNIL